MKSRRILRPVFGNIMRRQTLVDLREIKRQRLLKVFENREPIWKDEDHPDIGDSTAWIRQMRTESEARIERIYSDTHTE